MALRNQIKSDLVIRTAKPKDKDYRISDGDGLYLLVKTAETKSKWWRLDYSVDGKRKTISLGTYPDISLKSARERADIAREQVAKGIDPSDVRKAEKAQIALQDDAQKRIQQGLPPKDSFEEVAREWFDKFCANWSESHTSKIIARLENDVFPWIGQNKIGTIEPPELLAVLRRVENRGALETAHRELATCGQIFRYAISTARASRDIAADLRGALPPYKKNNHFAAVTEPKKLAELLRDIDGYHGTLVVRTALKLSPLLMVRPGELRTMRWADVDLQNAHWTYHVTKTKVPHIVPLAKQAIAALEEIKPLTGHLGYVFPSERDRDRPMSDNAVRSALRKLGWTNEEVSPHGFRATASTMLDNMGYKQEWLERQLAHRDPNLIRAAYKREEWKMYLPERAQMMQAWADFLGGLKAGTPITITPPQTIAAAIMKAV